MQLSRGTFAALALVLAAFVLGVRAHAAPRNVMADFRAFYCGAQVAAAGHDPYRTQPLLGCERAAQPPRAPAFLDAVAMPAPLPGYALAAFAPLARLPFGFACALWFGALGIGLAGRILVLYRLGAGSTALLAAALAPLAFGESMLLGQPMPLVMLAVVAAAWALASGRPRLAALAAAASTLEPHVGLAACAGLFAGAPRTRPLLLLAAAVAAAATVAFVGPAAALEYVRAVLPAHALANVPESSQLSLAAILYAAHVPAQAAVHAGETMYVLMLVLGVAVALGLRRLDGDPMWLAVVPPAFVVFGGVHVHDAQTAAALPALLLLAARVPRVRTTALLAVTLVMVPWFAVADPVLVAAAPLFGALLGHATADRRLKLLLPAVTTAIALVAVALAAFEPSATPGAVGAAAPSALAEDGWAAYVRAALSQVGPIVIWLRSTIVFGLALGVAAFLAAARPAVSALIADLRENAPGRIGALRRTARRWACG